MVCFYCKNGHKLGKHKEKPYNFCPFCGEKVISDCPHCGVEIGYITGDAPYEMKYCVNCGKPLFEDEKRKTVIKALKYASHDLSFITVFVLLISRMLITLGRLITLALLSYSMRLFRFWSKIHEWRFLVSINLCTLNEAEKEQLLTIQKALIDFIVRVSGDEYYRKTPEEIAILPEIVKTLISVY